MDIMKIWEEFNKLNGTNFEMPKDLLNLSSIEDYKNAVEYDLLRGETLDAAMQNN